MTFSGGFSPPIFFYKKLKIFGMIKRRSQYVLMEAFITNQKKMEIKVAFYKGTGDLFNKIVRWWTKSPYSHAELILPDGVTWIRIGPFSLSLIHI